MLADAGRDAGLPGEAGAGVGRGAADRWRQCGAGVLGTLAQVGGARFDVGTAPGCAGVLAAVGNGPALLVPDADTYLAQVAQLLAALDDGAVETWLLHPSGKVAFHVVLRDAPTFDAWLHQPKPGALRIIQRR